MQRILDIDLDFFLDKILYANDEPRGRLSDQEYQPDPEAAALTFLRDRCLLSQDHPTPGHTCKHHREVFFHWRSMLKSSELKAPFEVIHVDAHADMGLGNNSCLYIAEEMLADPPGKRSVPTGRESWQLGDCNFIAYALATRWIGKLTYVTHPNWVDDIQWLHMKDFDTKSGFVQMKRFNPGFTEGLNDFMDVKNLPFEAEPDIPLDVSPRSRFQLMEPADFVFISQSPNYTPKTADKLFASMKQFVKPI